MQIINVVLFDNFETLDACGPIEIFGSLGNEYRIEYYSMHGGIVTSRQGLQTQTQGFTQMAPDEIVLIPGGMGTRPLVNDDEFLSQLAALARQAKNILTVCTGSALLAKTGLLNAKRATSNKLAFDWVTSLNPAVDWVAKARWVVDGNIYTSSGVSAGMDMALGYVNDHLGTTVARKTAHDIEYSWNEDPDNDPFARLS
ncbi:MAG: DJ-1/PfpI family protein [Bifidobacterium aquikefiri]|uniref:Dimethyladenosine transferase n=1 Tax=Bifidobacterium aquikefiri TaxID=1653207 RepID=A0A261G7W7_9BIFI|nr:DJ-1/PfpI family protein [Bifidobacterium aquikefiri]OZG67275.1 dimethyladenosine transferase [Bifidobacterium aquikefiri]